MADEPMARDADQDDDEGLSLLDLAIPLAEHWKLLVIGPLLAGLAALGITYLIAPTFTARTVFLPPQQQQSVGRFGAGVTGRACRAWWAPPPTSRARPTSTWR